MAGTIIINGVELILSDPDEITNMEWIGGEVYMQQLIAAWMLVDPQKDIPMNPQILGKPGVGKTTLAYTAGKKMSLPVYIYQCTVDTRPEDLLISPVIGENNTIKYHASSLVSAMIKGGVCILDEANRMSEKSWASLAPLLDTRRYIESIIAGIKVQAHPNFRVCVTMNDDSSTFEVPEYIHSRLQPQIFIEFPERDEEFKILQFNIPFAKKDLIDFTVQFLQQAHRQNKPYTVRDGINICRYYLKLIYNTPEKKNREKQDLDQEFITRAIHHVLNQEAVDFLKHSDSHKPPKGPESQHFKTFFDKLNQRFLDERGASQKKTWDDESDEEEDDFDMEPDDDLSESEDTPDDNDFIDEIDEDLFDPSDDKEDSNVDEHYLDNIKGNQNDVIHIEPSKENKENDPFLEDDVDEPGNIIKDFIDRKLREKNGKEKTDSDQPADPEQPKEKNPPSEASSNSIPKRSKKKSGGTK